jgi:hypothetical protein
MDKMDDLNVGKRRGIERDSLDWNTELMVSFPQVCMCSADGSMFLKG